MINDNKIIKSMKIEYYFSIISPFVNYAIYLKMVVNEIDNIYIDKIATYDFLSKYTFFLFYD
jgi:hypothetical protein